MPKKTEPVEFKGLNFIITPTRYGNTIYSIDLLNKELPRVKNVMHAVAVIKNIPSRPAFYRVFRSFVPNSEINPDVFIGTFDEQILIEERRPLHGNRSLFSELRKENIDFNIIRKKVFNVQDINKEERYSTAKESLPLLSESDELQLEMMKTHIEQSIEGINKSFDSILTSSNRILEKLGSI